MVSFAGFYRFGRHHRSRASAGNLRHHHHPHRHPPSHRRRRRHHRRPLAAEASIPKRETVRTAEATKRSHLVSSWPRGKISKSRKDSLELY